MAAPDLSKREERVKLALANPIFFLEYYVRPYDPNWVTPMAAFARDLLRFIIPAKKAAIMMPPEFMKTTLVSQGYPLWDTLRSAYFKQLLRGMLMSEEEGMAKANLSVVKWHIEENELIARDFREPDDPDVPLLRPHPSIAKWSESEILIDRPGVSRDPTWRAKGLDSKGVHGSRLDRFIGDDLVTPRNAHSPALRKQALDTMDLQIETRIVAGGQMLVAGNFNDDKDLLSTLARRPRWATFRRPSIHIPGDPSTAPKESDLKNPARAIPTWPENWTMQRLLDEYDEKPNRFRRIHLLDPRAEHGERLNVDWMTLLTPNQTPFRYARFYIGLDGAPGGETEDLDFMNVTVVALSEQHCDIVETHDTRTSIGRQIEILSSIYDRYQRLGYGVVAIGAPKGAIDTYLKGTIETIRPDLIPKLEPISTPGQKEVRLEGLGPFASSGWLRCQESAWNARTSDAEDQYQELSLYEQWRDFPFGGHDDKLDGADVAIRTALDFALVGERTIDLQVAET